MPQKRYPGVRKRNGRLYIRYRLGGRDSRQVEELVPVQTRAEAAAIRERRLREIADGTWESRRERRLRDRAETGVTLPDAPRFSRLIELYRKDWLPHLRAQTWHEQMLSILNAKFGNAPIHTIRPDSIEAWRDELVEAGRAPETVRKYLVYLQGVYSRALETPRGRRLVATNPVRDVRKPRPVAALKLVLTVELARQLLQDVNRDADEPLWRWALIVLRTGCRVEEARRFLGRDLDRDAGLLAVRRAKKKPRYIATDLLGEGQEVTDGELWRELEAWDVRPAEPLIGQKFADYHSAKKRWRELFDRAEVPYGLRQGGATARNLRTTFVQLAYLGGFRPVDVAPQTGHSMDTLEKYYLELSPRRPRLERPRYPDLIPHRSHT